MKTTAKHIAAIVAAAFVAISVAGCAEFSQALDDAHQKILAHNAKLRAEIDAMNAGRSSGQRVGTAVGQGSLYHALAVAIEKGDVNTVKRCISMGADVNAEVNPLAPAEMELGANFGAFGAGGWPALVMAANRGHTNIVELLLEHGADPNARNEHGSSALMYSRGKSRMVRALIAKGADVNATDEDFVSVLSHIVGSELERLERIRSEEAKNKNRAEAAKRLVQMHATQEEYEDVLEGIRILKDAGAKENPLADVGVREADAYGNTTLMAAAKKGNQKEVRRLIAAGADVEAKNKGGKNALMFAIDNPPVAKILLDKGANPNATNRYGETVLCQVSHYSEHYAKMVNLLLDKGAQANVSGRGGFTPLMSAAIRCDAAVVKRLIAAGADVSAVGGNDFAEAEKLTAYDFASGAVDELGCDWWGNKKDAKAVLNMLKPSGKKAATKKKR